MSESNVCLRVGLRCTSSMNDCQQTRSCLTYMADFHRSLAGTSNVGSAHAVRENKSAHVNALFGARNSLSDEASQIFTKTKIT